MKNRTRVFFLSSIMALALPPLAVAQSTVMSEAAVQYPALEIGGFSDINFFANDKESTGTQSGFSEGQFVLHFTSALAPRLGFFGELSTTARSTGFVLNVERVIIRWDHSDYLKFSLGRYHTPINWWNTAFHHGQWLQTTVSRPEMTKFGGKFIPVHFIGGLVEGAVPAGGFNVNYTVGVGNGRASDITTGGDAGDSNNNRAWLASFFVRPDKAYHLQAGLAYYEDLVTLPDKKDYDEEIMSAYVVWLREDPELIGEYALIEHHERASGERWDSDAYYLQAAYRLPWNKARWKPYFRYERMEIEIDPIFSDLPNRKSLIAGVRYDFSDYLALKVEYRKDRNNTEKNVNALFAQLSYAF